MVLHLDALLDHCEEVSCSVSDHPEELATAESIITDSDTAVPDADDDHDVCDVHLLEDGEQFLTTAVLSVVIEALSKHFFLLNWVKLVHSVGQDAVLGRGKLRAGFRVRNIAEVVNYETHLVFVRDRCCICLELKLLVLLGLSL